MKKMIAMMIGLVLVTCMVAPTQADSNNIRERVTNLQDDSHAWYLTVFSATEAEGQQMIQEMQSDEILQEIMRECRVNVITPEQRRYQALAGYTGNVFPAVWLQRPDAELFYNNYGDSCDVPTIAGELPQKYQTCMLFGGRRRGNYSNKSADPPAPKVTEAEQAAAETVLEEEVAYDKEFRRRPRPCPSPAPAPAPQPVQPVPATPIKQVRPATSTSQPIWLYVVAGVVGLGGILAAKFLGEMRSGK